MLPVGMRNASIMNARKTKANIKAVISHSKVFATSAAISFLFRVFLLLSADINAIAAVNSAHISILTLN